MGMQLAARSPCSAARHTGRPCMHSPGTCLARPHIGLAHQACIPFVHLHAPRPCNAAQRSR